MKIIQVPFIILEIEKDGFHIMVKGKMNELEANFLIDTGASRSVFDNHGILKFIKNQKLKGNGMLSTGLGTNSMPSYLAHINNITLGNLQINDYQATVIDLSHVHESYQQLALPEIDGVLGGDILHRFKVVINYKTRKLKFYL